MTEKDLKEIGCNEEEVSYIKTQLIVGNKIELGDFMTNLDKEVKVGETTYSATVVNDLVSSKILKFLDTEGDNLYYECIGTLDK